MQIVNLKCTLITCKSTAVKCIILCNIYFNMPQKDIKWPAEWRRGSVSGS